MKARSEALGARPGRIEAGPNLVCDPPPRGWCALTGTNETPGGTPGATGTAETRDETSGATYGGWQTASVGPFAGPAPPPMRGCGRQARAARPGGTCAVQPTAGPDPPPMGGCALAGTNETPGGTPGATGTTEMQGETSDARAGGWQAVSVGPSAGPAPPPMGGCGRQARAARPDGEGAAAGRQAASLGAPVGPAPPPTGGCGRQTRAARPDAKEAASVWQGMAGRISRGPPRGPRSAPHGGVRPPGRDD